MFGSHTGKLPRPKLKTSNTALEILNTLVFIVAVTVLFDLAIPRSLVDGHSMDPTFRGADRLVVSRLHYLLGEPQRGDIVVFNSVNERESAQGVMLIKRVVGLPGETLEFRDQQVYIDGELLDEPYIKEPCQMSRCRDAIWELAENEFFVMGDNRNNSNDSRRFDAVPIQHIVGQVIFRYFPLNSLGIIPN